MSVSHLITLYWFLLWNLAYNLTNYWLITLTHNLTQWLEYSAKGLLSTLERVWLRLQKFQSSPAQKINLTPRQEHLLGLLRDHGSLAPAEIWEHLKISKQGAINIIKPLIEAGLIEKRGTQNRPLFPSLIMRHFLRFPTNLNPCKPWSTRIVVGIGSMRQFSMF